MDDWLDEFELRLAESPTPSAPAELRDAVLKGVRLELVANRWDRRLGRTAAVLLVAGIGANAAIGLRQPRAPQPALASEVRTESLTQVAASVAEATDASTGRLIAHQLAALTGRSLTSEESAAIDSAADHRAAGDFLNGKDG